VASFRIVTGAAVELVVMATQQKLMLLVSITTRSTPAPHPNNAKLEHPLPTCQGSEEAI